MKKLIATLMLSTVLTATVASANDRPQTWMSPQSANREAINVVVGHQAEDTTITHEYKGQYHTLDVQAGVMVPRRKAPSTLVRLAPPTRRVPL